MKTYGLLGHPLSHSFSKSFFTEKFEKEHIHAQYLNFDLADIGAFAQLIQAHPDLEGLNVTIPYKEAVIPFLDELDPTAKEIGAVNVIRIERKDGAVRLIGYNSDVVGFRESLRPLLLDDVTRALVLGTGGASKAVVYALRELGIESRYVSRKGTGTVLGYDQLDAELIGQYPLVVNTTPLGMYPNLTEKPSLPYEGVKARHILYDLIYNPETTAFLEEGMRRGAVVKNGYEMLILQALESWRIWNQL